MINLNNIKQRTKTNVRRHLPLKLHNSSFSSCSTNYALLFSFAVLSTFLIKNIDSLIDHQ